MKALDSNRMQFKDDTQLQFRDYSCCTAAVRSYDQS